MMQNGGMFTHQAIPKVCSHTREVEFLILNIYILALKGDNQIRTVDHAPIDYAIDPST